jgi:hypothetical protein
MNTYTFFFFKVKKYSPKRCKNVGLTDGEGVERLWSFLRLFSKMTKEMSKDKRIDVLTDAALHYGEHLFNGIPLRLQDTFFAKTF